MPVTPRTLRAAGLAAGAMAALHVMQVAVLGHDLIPMLDGHGLDLLPGALLSPSPALLLATLTLAFGLSVLVVLLVVRAMDAAPPSQAAGDAGVVATAPGALAVARLGGAPAFGRAPPRLRI